MVTTYCGPLSLLSARVTIRSHQGAGPAIAVVTLKRGKIFIYLNHLSILMLNEGYLYNA